MSFSFNCSKRVKSSMFMLKKKYLEFTQWFLVFFLFYSLAVNASNELVLQNFGKPIKLYPLANKVYKSHEGIEFKFSNAILVKTKKSISPVEIKQLLKPAVRLERIASLEFSVIYIVYLDGGDVSITSVFDAANQLMENGSVIYAQPDFWQRANAIKRGERKRFPAVLRKDISISVPPCSKNDECDDVSIAVIDEDFNFSHPDFERLDVIAQFDVDQIHSDGETPHANSGHGTSVAGVLALLQTQSFHYPKPRLVAIKQTSTRTSEMIMAFNLALEQGVDIINCSWVLPFLPEPLADVIQYAASDAGGVKKVLVSAGNHGLDACKDNVLTNISGVEVIGAGMGNNPEGYSNYGACVDFYAPYGFTVPAHGGNGYGNFSGTSSSAALVASIYARTLSSKKMIPSISDLQSYIKSK